MPATKYLNKVTNQWEFVATGEATTEPRGETGNKPVRIWLDQDEDSPAGGGGGGSLTAGDIFLYDGHQLGINNDQSLDFTGATDPGGWIHPEDATTLVLPVGFYAIQFTGYEYEPFDALWVGAAFYCGPTELALPLPGGYLRGTVTGLIYVGTTDIFGGVYFERDAAPATNVNITLQIIAV